jgi:hypothetical protein
MTKGRAEIFWSITNRNIDTAKIQAGRSIPGFYSAAQPTPAQRGCYNWLIISMLPISDISFAVHGLMNE